MIDPRMKTHESALGQSPSLTPIEKNQKDLTLDVKELAKTVTPFDNN